MNRLVTPLLACALLTLAAGCNPADTAPDEKSSTPTPEPTPVFSNETYAKALKTMSYRLRGLPPPYADTQAVLAGGQEAYNDLVDRYLDPAQNTLLGPSLREFYRQMFLMGQTIGGVNFDQVPNLATYLILNDRPVTEMLTAEYCVENNFQQAADCTDGAPAGQRAGVISNKAFLEKYGQEDTVNMRRVSVVHQLFACGIYPDPEENPPPLSRTNIPEAQWPINNSGSPDDPSDDFPDPGEAYADCPDDGDPSNGVCITDPMTDSQGRMRLHKKYQSKLPSASGARCHDCHGLLNARRPVFTFYDPEGVYNPARSIGLNNTTPEDNVENPSVNGDQDYCGAITTDLDDDIEPGTLPYAYDCSAQNPQAIYFGRPMTTLKDFGALIIDRSISDRFYRCMTTRHYNFVLGKSQGELSMQAAGGSGPPAMGPSTLQKFMTVYEGAGWSTRELFRATFKSTEYLSTQGPQITP